jgi:hypothetical protein
VAPSGVRHDLQSRSHLEPARTPDALVAGLVIAILGVVALSSVAMTAPILWTAILDSSSPKLGACDSIKVSQRDAWATMASRPIIAVMWSTQMSPGDVRMLRASQLRRDTLGTAFFTDRAKTGKPVGGMLSYRALAALRAYLAILGCEFHGDAPIFVTRGQDRGAVEGGRPWQSRPYKGDRLGRDFRIVRTAEFGESEQRTLADFRRSTAVEAIAGEATPAALAHAMGNTLSASNALFATYCPVNLTSLRDVMEARRRGRRKLR